MFKTCPSCKRRWKTKVEYMEDCELVALTDCTGLTLWNCRCGTTHGWDAICFWPERAAEIISAWISDRDFAMAPELHARRVTERGLRETLTAINIDIDTVHPI